MENKGFDTAWIAVCVLSALLLLGCLSLAGSAGEGLVLFLVIEIPALLGWGLVALLTRRR